MTPQRLGLNRYINSKIYKLICYKHFYIGYTCTSLSKRLYYHRHKNNIFVDKTISIELIKNVVVHNKNELLQEYENVLNIYSIDPFCINNTRKKKRKYITDSDESEAI